MVNTWTHLHHLNHKRNLQLSCPYSIFSGSSQGSLKTGNNLCCASKKQPSGNLRQLKNNVQHHATQSCGCCCGATDAHRVFKGLNTAQASAPDSGADVQAESESGLQGRARWAKGPRDISQFLLIIRLGRNLNGCFFTMIRCWPAINFIFTVVADSAFTIKERWDQLWIYLFLMDKLGQLNPQLAICW